MKWMRILIVCHMMLDGTEKLHFFAAAFIIIIIIIIKCLRSSFTASN